MFRIRLLFAWLVLAAIPLQGFAAASMLYCGMGPGHGAQVQPRSASSDRTNDHHDHADGAHSHAKVEKVDKSLDEKAQLPDSSHKCGVCASCGHSAAMTETPRSLAVTSMPQARAVAPLVLIHPRPSPVPDKPPRA